jgi:hypothetical protein
MPYVLNPFTGELNIALKGSSKIRRAKFLIPFIYNKLFLFNTGTDFDPDALAYCQASGATDFQAINYFVKGIKSLGLWNDMVCWPLRSTQNAGTGSTAYSLGGLGTYNGTLINGPTWGADGITFAAASSQRIDVSTSLVFSPTTVPWNVMAVQNQTIAAASATSFGRGNVVNSDRSWLAGVSGGTTSNFLVSDGVATSSVNIAAGSSLNTFAVFQGFSENDFIRLSSNDSVFQTAAARTPNQATDQTLRIGAVVTTPSGLSSRYFSGKIPFTLFGNSASANSTALYNLYKSTLGQGLGLP